MPNSARVAAAQQRIGNRPSKCRPDTVRNRIARSQISSCNVNDGNSHFKNPSRAPARRRANQHHRAAVAGFSVESEAVRFASNSWARRTLWGSRDESPFSRRHSVSGRYSRPLSALRADNLQAGQPSQGRYGLRHRRAGAPAIARFLTCAAPVRRICRPSWHAPYRVRAAPRLKDGYSKSSQSQPRRPSFAPNCHVQTPRKMPFRPLSMILPQACRGDYFSLAVFLAAAE